MATIAQPISTVVIPAYNAERTIGDAINSVLTGKLEDVEVIVCDDASTDGTVNVVRSFRDPRVRLVQNEINMGQGPSRDRATDVARGGWIARLDADDMYTPDRLDTLIAVAKVHPGSIVLDELMECHDTPRGMRPWRAVRQPHTFPGEPSATRQIGVSDWLSQNRWVIQPVIPTEMIRKHQLRHSKQRCGEDTDFFLKALARSGAPFWYVPRPMYLYRMTPRSMSSVAGRYSMILDMLEAALPLFADQPATTQVLRNAIARTRRTEEYWQFYTHLLHREPASAFRCVLERPWVFPEFLSRSARQIPYHIDRWWNGGQRRARS